MTHTITIQSAQKIINDGGIIAYPTETFYGLGVDAKNEEAIRKIFQIKNRDQGKPISILIGSIGELSSWAKNIGEKEKKLINKYWPGPLTIIFNARKSVSKLLTAGTGKIGVRISSHLDANRLVKKVGAITTTSANLSGEPSTTSSHVLGRKIGSKIDGILNAGTLRRSVGSTVIDCTSQPFKILREGKIKREEIENVLQSKTI